MRIVLAEDGGLVREALTRVLAEAGFEVVAAVGDPDALAAAVATHAPDVAIVDVRMPPTYTDEGIRAVETLRAANDRTGVLVLTQSADSGHAVRLLADTTGGTGYLLKDRVADIAELADAIRRVAGGGTVVDPTVVARLVGRSRSMDRVDALTPREREVPSLMAEGRSNLGIAERLFVTEKTVETHVASILGKLGLEPTTDDHRRVLAVLEYLRAG
ncbi:MAG TPA: response regulator transcription factor [Candidatus Limnocylindrales bacterium]